MHLETDEHGKIMLEYIAVNQRIYSIYMNRGKWRTGKPCGLVERQERCLTGVVERAVFRRVEAVAEADGRRLGGVTLLVHVGVDTRAELRVEHEPFRTLVGGQRLVFLRKECM